MYSCIYDRLCSFHFFRHHLTTFTFNQLWNSNQGLYWEAAIHCTRYKTLQGRPSPQPERRRKEDCCSLSRNFFLPLPPSWASWASWEARREVWGQRTVSAGLEDGTRGSAKLAPKNLKWFWLRKIVNCVIMMISFLCDKWKVCYVKCPSMLIMIVASKIFLNVTESHKEDFNFK